MAAPFPLPAARGAAHGDQGRRRLLASLPLLTLAPWLTPALADPQVQRASRPLMGTRVDIVVDHGGPGAAAAIEAAFAEMARLSRQMSRYERGNPVAALEAAAGRHPVPVPAEMLAVLALAQTLSQRSAGAFDISVGAFSGWGFESAQTSIPDASELARERLLVNYQDVLFDTRNSTALLKRPGMRIDLGGIAKLPILEAGMQVLRRHGMRNAMLNGGGDVRVSGRLQGRDWCVGLRDPLAPERLLGVVELDEGWVAASGDYERCFERAGRRYHHILNPRSGLPSRAAHGVTLVARNLDPINGLGAALMVMGAQRGRHLLVPEVDALIVQPDGRRWLSPGMAGRLRA